MSLSTRLPAAFCALLWISSCGDDGSDAEVDRRLADLSADDVSQRCRDGQARYKEQFQNLALVSCTGRSRQGDTPCADARAACIAAIPVLDFDICESAEAKARTEALYRAAFQDDPDLAGSLTPPGAEAMNVPAMCPVTVRQFDACLDDLSSLLARAAQAFTCDSDEASGSFATPKTCSYDAATVDACTLPAAP